MLFSSDDDLPEVPTVEAAPPPPQPAGAPLSSSAEQQERLQQLEAAYRASRNGTSSGRHRSTARRGSSPPQSPVSPAAVSPPHIWEERDEAAFYELRSLVPHLSPTFACSYGDAVLLIAAVRSGGAVGGERHTLADKCQSLEADRRQLEQRLEKSRAQCDALKDEVAEARQKLKAVQEEARNSVNLLAQRREETRRQLLMEETKAEKLAARNRKLDLENEALKERVRGQLR